MRSIEIVIEGDDFMEDEVFYVIEDDISSVISRTLHELKKTTKPGDSPVTVTIVVDGIVMDSETLEGENG